MSRWLGLKADVSGHYGTPLTLSPEGQAFISNLGVSGFPPRATSYSFLFGPVGYRSVGRYRPFIHALFGATLLHTGTVSIGAVVQGIPIQASTHISDTAFAMAIGGGFDWRVKDHILIRAAQADYFYTKHDFRYGAAGDLPPALLKIASRIISCAAISSSMSVCAY